MGIGGNTRKAIIHCQILTGPYVTLKGVGVSWSVDTVANHRCGHRNCSPARLTVHHRPAARAGGVFVMEGWEMKAFRRMSAMANIGADLLILSLGSQFVASRYLDPRPAPHLLSESGSGAQLVDILRTFGLDPTVGTCLLIDEI